MHGSASVGVYFVNCLPHKSCMNALPANFCGKTHLGFRLWCTPLAHANVCYDERGKRPLRGSRLPFSSLSAYSRNLRGLCVL